MSRTALRTKISESYSRLPMAFESNRGQTDARVKFLSRGPGYSVFLTATEAVLLLRPPAAAVARESRRPAEAVAVRMKLVRGSAAPEVEGVDELPGRSNYFMGNDPAKWRTDVANYARVRYKGVYPGVDVVYYGNQGELEYDFVVAPGADPQAIRLAFEGAEGLEVDAGGDLLLRLPAGSEPLRIRRPVLYQAVAGARREVPGRYELRGRQVGISVAPYRRDLPLVIDPLVVHYATYLGSSGMTIPYAIALDLSDCLYVTGVTQGTDYPIVGGRLTSPTALSKAFVSKLNDGALIYSTYLGGSVGESGTGIAVDAAGNAYVVGNTGSKDFPTVSAFQGAFAGGENDAFVAKINPSGNALLYSTYLGGTGNDGNPHIAVDSLNSAYVTGHTRSADFPTTAGALQRRNAGAGNVFLTKLNPAGSAPVYSTYLGGSGDDVVAGIAVDSSANAYLTGSTSSTDFPTMNAMQPMFGGGASDIFVAKINQTGASLLYSTYLGGSGADNANGIAVDASGSVYIAGQTASTNFPALNAYQLTFGGGNSDAFLTRLDSSGSYLIFSTFLGGKSQDRATGVALGPGGVYVTGDTASSDFPSVNALKPFDNCEMCVDAFVSKFDASGTPLRWSSNVVGGAGGATAQAIAVDPSDVAHVAIAVFNNQLPTSFLATQPAGIAKQQTTQYIIALYTSPNNEVGTPSSLIPSTVEPGKAFMLSVSGLNFVPGCVIRWNGQDRPTTFINGMELRADISAVDVAGAGTAEVRIYTPPPGGGVSFPKTLTITPSSTSNNPVPALIALSPSSAVIGQPSLMVLLMGANFVSNSVVRWNGKDHAATYVSSTSMQLSLSAGEMAQAASVVVTVFNPAPGGGESNVLRFTIQAPNPVPVLTSISPASGSAGLTSLLYFAVNGSNFVSGATVRWNGKDHAATFLGPTKMELYLNGEDLAQAGTAQVTVWNPLPGGGESNALTFTIENDTPRLISLSPASTLAGQASALVTVNGYGFVAGSVLRWNGKAHTAAYMSATSMQVSLTAAELVQAGSVQVTVFNPAPGGGESNALAFTIQAPNPAPVLTSLSPASATVGQYNVVVTLNGSNFVSGSVVRWNGKTHGATYLSATSMQIYLSSEDVAAPGSAQITVFNPAPGGGESGAVTFAINNPVARVTGLTPWTIAAGGGALTLKVSGSLFTRATVVRWNGSDRTTVMTGSNEVSASITADDVALPGAAEVTAFNPAPGGGISNAVNFLVHIALPTNDIVYDPFTQRIYASVPSKAGARGNSITSIDPRTGTIGQSIYIGSEPGKLALSDDGRFLYVALDGAGAVRQFDLLTQTPGLQFSLGDSSTALMYAADIKVLPGNADAIAAIRRAGSPTGNGVLSIYDGGVKRGKDTDKLRYIDAFEPSDSGLLLYGASGSSFVRMGADSSGVSILDSASGLIGASYGTASIRFDGGALYAGTGEVIDPVKRTLIGKYTGFPSGGSFRPDSTVGRTFFLGSADYSTNRLTVFYQRTFTPDGTADFFGGSTKFTGLIRWGSDGLAFRTADQVFVIRTSLVAGSPADSPAPVVTGVSPASAVAGGKNLTVAVIGSNFTPYSIVRWNGSERATRFVNSRQLTAFIPAGDLGSPGSASVTVFTPPPKGGSSESITFTVNSAPGSPPAANAGGLVHGASFKPKAALAGGGIVSLFGSNLAPTIEAAGALPLPTVLGGVSVRVNGIAAPLFFVSPDQINLILPWEAVVEGQAAVTVMVGGMAGNSQMIDLVRSAPGIFTIDQSGGGQGAIMIAGTTSLAAPAGSLPNARPVTAGEFLSIFCSGLGDVINRPANGAAAPGEPLAMTAASPTVTIDGLPAAATFSGLAPGFAGLYQVNVQAPSGVQKGNAIPVVLTIGGVSSNTVTIAVQ